MSYSTESAAVQAAIRQAFAYENSRYVEYGGWIYKVGNSYTYDIYVAEGADRTASRITIPAPQQSGYVAFYHTHYDNTGFSPVDMQVVLRYGVRYRAKAYLGTPAGGVYLLDGTNSEIRFLHIAGPAYPGKRHWEHLYAH